MIICQNPHLEQAIKLIKEAGIGDYIIVPGGKHTQLKWLHEGHQRTATLPNTASDWRSMLNSRADVKHILRADGLLLPEPKAEPKPKQLTLEQRIEKLERQVERLTGQRQ